MGQDYSTPAGLYRICNCLRSIQSRIRKVCNFLFCKRNEKVACAESSPAASHSSKTSGKSGFREFLEIDLSDQEPDDILVQDKGKVRWGKNVPERGTHIPSAFENWMVLKSAAELWERNCPKGYPMRLPDWKSILKRPIVEQQVAVRLYVQKVSDMLFSLDGKDSLSMARGAPVSNSEDSEEENFDKGTWVDMGT